MSKREATQAKFNEANLKRHDLSDIPKSLQELIHYMDYKIRKDIKSFTLLSLCGGDRSNFLVDHYFQRAFSTLNTDEKVNLYSSIINNSLECSQKEKQLKSNEQVSELANESKLQKSNEMFQDENINLTISMCKGYKKWEETAVEIVGFKVQSKNSQPLNIDLRNYILRKSKKKQKRCYALEAIKASTQQTIRFAFLSEEEEMKNLPLILERIGQAQKFTISRQIFEIRRKKKVPNSENNLSTTQFKLKTNASNSVSNNQNQLQQSLHEKVGNNLSTNIRNSSYTNNLIIPQVNRSKLNQSVCEQIVKSKDEQNFDEELSEIIAQQNQEVEMMKMNVGDRQIGQVLVPKSYRNIYKIMLPSYELSSLSHFLHYGSVYQSKKTELYIYRNERDQLKYKMQMNVSLPVQTTCKAIYNFHLYKHWHSEVEQAQIKLQISSQNSCISYMKMKAYSQWYRNRDYLQLMHLFHNSKNEYFIVSKSIENTNFIPFQSITRGNVEYIVWRIKSIENDPNQSEVIMECRIDHGGLLNVSHQSQLTMRFLKGFQGMQGYFANKANQEKLTNTMGFHWLIDENLQEGNRNRNNISHENLNSLRTCDFESGSEISDESDLVFYSIDNMSEEDDDFDYSPQPVLKSHSEPINYQISQPKDQSKDSIKRQLKFPEQESKKSSLKFREKQEISEHELDEPSIMINSHMIQSGNGEHEKILLNEEGRIILPKKYLKKKHVMVPFDTEIKKIQMNYEDIVRKNDWELDKSGHLKLVDEVKLAAQNNVFKFIMKTLKENLFSGKGILNISLPVEIFNIDSNLQRVCQGLSLTPEIMEKALKADNALERFKYILAVGLSNSLIYFDVQKPFNPILGETYQGFIRGCPVYGEQTSHHPPISSIYFVGRGFKIYASLEGKVRVRMNAGDGINEGFYTIKLDNGQQILFQTPPAEISGLAYGDRRFSMKGKGYYIDIKNRLYCEMKFESDGGFFHKKKREYADQIEGEIVMVSEQFITKFLAAPNDKKPSPGKSDIIETCCELGGRWTSQLKIDNKVYYNILKEIPDRMIDDIYPLNSNSNYREDLYYRKQHDLTKSQMEKERLQVFQRGDRKLREKFHGPQEH